jgi:hypothetical protein
MWLERGEEAGVESSDLGERGFGNFLMLQTTLTPPSYQFGIAPTVYDLYNRSYDFTANVESIKALLSLLRHEH